ncbi:MAG: TlpA family protein disulfide reductase [Tepidiformaceae bacterium]
MSTDGKAGDSGELDDLGTDEPVPGLDQRRRHPLRDFVLPLAAVAGVFSAILLVQMVRERGHAPSSVANSGHFYSLEAELGPAGKGTPKLGQAAPGFQLVDTRGQLVRLEDFRGRPVLLNFWASWCVPCRRETPDLIALQAEWATTAQILGVNYYESAAAAREFADEFAVNYPLPLDSDGRVTGSYKLTGLPETFFLDGDGIIRDHRIGQLSADVARCIVAGIGAGRHEPKDCR